MYWLTLVQLQFGDDHTRPVRRIELIGAQAYLKSAFGYSAFVVAERLREPLVH